MSRLEDPIADGYAALRAGDSAAAREAFASAPSGARPGAVEEGLAEALREAGLRVQGGH